MKRYYKHIAILVLAVVLGGLSGCNPRKDAIGVSQSTLDFGLSELDIRFQVWNTEKSIDSLPIAVTARESWLLTDVNEVTSVAPDANGTLSKQTISVSIDRSQLAKGDHEGRLLLSAPGANPVYVTVKVRQDTEQPAQGDLNLSNIVSHFSKPYLLDFNFTLEDKDGNPVVAEPGQLIVVAKEGQKEVGVETGVHLRRAAARKLKVDLVLDYSQSMQNSVAAMEEAVLNVLLPALNEDAQVGIIEFHVESSAPQRVAELTVERDYLEQRLDSIQSAYVQGFTGGSRVWDAISLSTEAFFPVNDAEEDRYILLFSDGDDTSSSTSRSDAINRAVKKNIHVFAIGFGNNVDEVGLKEIAKSTTGAYFPAASINELDDRFKEIVANLGSRYTLRWASLLRDDARAFKPAFEITLNDATARYLSTKNFTPSTYESNELQGRLSLDYSDTPAGATVFLRAAYVPRNITSLSLFIDSDFEFYISRVPVTSDGLLDDWRMDIEEAPELHGLWITLENPNGVPLPFATFGPLLRFNFGQIEDASTPLFNHIYIDNTLYPSGQTFALDGFDNTPPAAIETSK